MGSLHLHPQLCAPLAATLPQNPQVLDSSSPGAGTVAPGCFVLGDPAVSLHENTAPSLPRRLRWGCKITPSGRAGLQELQRAHVSPGCALCHLCSNTQGALGHERKAEMEQRTQKLGVGRGGETEDRRGRAPGADWLCLQP